MIGIYKITNPKGRVYIGQSINIRFRFQTYQRLRCKGQVRLYASFIKYGVDKHKFEIVELCEVKDLNEKERYYQEIYSCLGKYGMNCQLCKTKDLPYKHSEETKLKISKSNLGKIGRKGIKLTQEHKDKISNSTKGIKRPYASKRLTDWNKSNTGKKNSFFNKKHTKQSLKKMSDSRKGKNMGLENFSSKLVLELSTGVYYYSLSELCELNKFSIPVLSRKLSGIRKNNTSYIYV